MLAMLLRNILSQTIFENKSLAQSANSSALVKTKDIMNQAGQLVFHGSNKIVHFILTCPPVSQPSILLKGSD